MSGRLVALRKEPHAAAIQKRRSMQPMRLLVAGDATTAGSHLCRSLWNSPLIRRIEKQRGSELSEHEMGRGRGLRDSSHRTASVRGRLTFFFVNGCSSQADTVIETDSMALWPDLRKGRGSGCAAPFSSIVRQRKT
jgi:hypothetical protein